MFPAASATVNVSVPPMYLSRSLKRYHRDPGESPPPAPRNFVGRDELMERAISLINAGTPIALIGPGGIGKTSMALALLDDNRIKNKFGANRRFLRCNEVQSHIHFLRRLSEVTGAGIDNITDLTAIRPFFTSTNTMIVLDNAETILDPHMPHAPALYSTIEELSQTQSISLIITSRISIVPTTCQQLQVPALSMTPAREVFYNIYANEGRVAALDSLLQQLDHHPLSITVLATVATQNRWDHSRLIQEWERRRISLLEPHHNRGPTAAIELSLTSPMFTNLGPDARGILAIIAVLPQGVNEAELEWIFPTVSRIRDIVDTFFILSLTHRNHDFVTMLGFLREYLRPEGYSCTLFSSTRDQYLTRLHDIEHSRAPVQDTQWLVSERVNIDALLALSVRVGPDLADP